MDFQALAQQCAPNVAPQTLAALASVESSHNPYAIGVVGGALSRQPRSLREALESAAQLMRENRNFSVGLVQINRHNFAKHNVTIEQVFEPCTNLRVGGAILQACYSQAAQKLPDPQHALQGALSCYYSGNLRRGFIPDKPGEPSYVQKVVAAGTKQRTNVVVPAIAPETGVPGPAVRRDARATNHPVLFGPSDNTPGKSTPLEAEKAPSFDEPHVVVF